MTIELISFRYNMREQKRLNLMLELINISRSNLIVFCGHSLYYQESLKVLQSKIENKTATVLFEVRNIKENNNKFINLKNCLYLIKEGTIQNLFTSQLFSESAHINNNEALGERYINELETRRCFQVGDKICLVIQCGENNIIRNIQKEGNRPVFRLQERSDLEERFKNLLQHTDIILNPIHQPMGNSDKIGKRREYLSTDGRYYFSVSQNGQRKRNQDYYDISIESNCLQYGYHDGKPINEINRDVSEDYQRRIYII